MIVDERGNLIDQKTKKTEWKNHSKLAKQNSTLQNKKMCMQIKNQVSGQLNEYLVRNDSLRQKKDPSHISTTQKPLLSATKNDYAKSSSNGDDGTQEEIQDVPEHEERSNNKQSGSVNPCLFCSGMQSNNKL